MSVMRFSLLALGGLLVYLCCSFEASLALIKVGWQSGFVPMGLVTGLVVLVLFIAFRSPPST